MSHILLSLVVNFLQGLVVGFQFGYFSFDLLGLFFLAVAHQTANLL